MLQMGERLRVVDADSHMTERHDLFTERAPKGYEDKVPHVEQIDGVDMWVIEGKTFGKAGSGGTIDHDGKKHPFRDSQGGVVGHRRRAPGGLGPQGAAPPDGRARHRRPGALPELDRPRRPEPLRTRSHDPLAAPALRRALQRRHGRGAGGVGQPAPAHADHAGLGHRGLRARGRALRRAGLPRRQHDRRPAGLGLARPRATRRGTRSGRSAPASTCRCTSTSAPARPR